VKSEKNTQRFREVSPVTVSKVPAAYSGKDLWKRWGLERGLDGQTDDESADNKNELLCAGD